MKIICILDDFLTLINLLCLRIDIIIKIFNNLFNVGIDAGFYQTARNQKNLSYIQVLDRS